MRFTYLVTAWLFALAVTSLHAQEIPPQKYSINQLTSPPQRPMNYWVVDPPAKPGESSRDEVRIIVRFKSNLPSGSGKNGRLAAATIGNEHQQFLNDLQQFENRSSIGRSAPASKILFDYRQVFNGFALVTTTDIKEEIKKWKYVSYVTEDKKVQVSDLESSQIINAPIVWSQFSITGKGVTIGIIDTGIDYNHPDLGGGFGPGFKVKGGYDFVNNDSNPIDDHGHGTHVAGIAAANGPGLKGVAPDASLVAYKVLAAEGYGYDSWILAAIERTVDPDQNPNTQDALDVVNMSLGRAADANEPLSEAVNNAVAQGVTFVIAAGNSYDYLTIGTPGIAEHAITVAATDRNDVTAVFSSKGPSENTFALKPDVAAPGTDVYSSFKNAGYEILSGTSMASPHVTGAVALLLEKHPDWTPDMVKAALMSTAKKSSELIWNQGAGRIDVYEAIQSNFIVTPGSFSLGLAPEASPYIKTIRAKVYNQSNILRSFNFSTEGDINNSSFSVVFNPSSFSLNANASQDVDITFTINTSTLPIQNLPNAFTGYIVTSNGSQIIKSPVTLVNPQITKLKFEGDLPYNVFVFGVDPGNYFWKPYSPTSPELNLFLPSGTFDMISMFAKNHTVVTEGVSTSQNNTIFLSKNLAKNQIIFKPLDKSGQAIPITESTFGTGVFTGIDKNFMTFYPYAEDTFYISDQQSYRYDMKIKDKSPFDSEHFYDIVASTENGILQSKIYSNNPSSFTELNIFNPSAITNQGLVYYDRAGSPYFYFTIWNNNPIPVQNPLKILLSNNDPNGKFLGSYSRLSPAFQESGYSWETSVWKTGNNTNLTLQDKAGTVIADFSTSFDHYLGETLIRYSTQTANRTDKIVLLDTRNTGIFNRYYGERECGTVYFKLFAGENLIKEGNFANSTDQAGGTQQFDAVPQHYKMLLTYEDYQVQGKFGKATVVLDFNTSNSDMNTPHLNYLSLDVNGKSVNQFQVGEQATIMAKMDDWCTDQITWQECLSTGVASVSMYVKKAGTDNWIDVNAFEIQYTEYQVTLPSNLDEGYYALKLVAKDFSDNTITYELDPGFLIGEATESIPYANVNLIEPANRSINAGTNPVFRWSSFPSADYTIQISDTVDFTSTILEANTNAVNYNLPSPLQENKTYYWRVKANYAGKSVPWSVVYSFYSGTLKNTTLIRPMQDAIDQPLSVQFQWSRVDQVSSYGFQLSAKEDFSELQFQTFLQDTTVVVDNLLPNTQYFWNVTSNYFTWDNQYFIPSSTNHFKTFSVTGVDDPETQKGSYNYPNPFSTNTNIIFQTDKPGVATFTILDPLGQEVNRFGTEHFTGENSISWGGENKNNQLLSNGLYIGILKTAEGTSRIKMIIKR